MAKKAPGIRDAIKVLLAILSDCGCPQVPSETLRQAKYNKPEAKNTLWRPLYCMVQILQYLKSGDTGDIREAVSQTQSGPLKVTRMAHSIRKYAFELNYYRPQFYCDAEAVGSCELLLFFAWLLETTSFVPQLCHYHLRAASDSSIHLLPPRQFLMHSIEEEICTLERQVQDLSLSIASSSACIETALQKVLWLKETLNGSCASVHNAHRAAVRLSHSLLQSSTLHGSQARRQPLTIHNLFLLHYPEQLALYLKRLEWHITSLQNLLQWEQHEIVFWQWMESVLDQQSRQADANESETDSSHMSVAAEVPSVEYLAEEVAMLEQGLHQRLLVRRPHTDRVQRVWLSKERTSQFSHTEERLTKHQTQVLLSLPPVLLESTVYQPTLEPPSCHGAFKHSVEASIVKLVTRTEETGRNLHLLRSLIAEQLKQ